MKKKSIINLKFLSMLIIAVFVFAYFLSGSVQAKESVTSQGVASSNKSSNYYDGNWYHTIDSNLFLEGDKLVRVEHKDNDIIIEYYDKNYNLLSQKKIGMQKDAIYGGAYVDGGEHYLLFGYNNDNEDDNKAVIRLVKYDNGWNEIASCCLNGANTVSPFDAGTARFAKSGDDLFIRTCHLMYKSGDGFNHQANVTIHVNTKNMTIVNDRHNISNISTGYVSHSFNQFIQIDGDRLVCLDHGDAYPRALVICRYDDGISSGNPIRSTTDNVEILKFPGEIGNNNTDATVGSFEVAEKNYITAGVYNGNVFIATVPKDSFTENSVNLKYITSYSGDDLLSNTTPYLAKVDDDKFVLMWEKSSHTVSFVPVDQNGKKLDKIKKTTGSLSECPPVVVDGKPVWYYTDDSAPIFCYPLERPSYKGKITGTIGYGERVFQAIVTFPEVYNNEGALVAGEWSFDEQNLVVKTKSKKTVYATFKSQDSSKYDDIKYAKVELTVKDTKLKQPMVVKAKKKTIKFSKLKKKAQSVKPMTVKSAQGTVTYKITGGNKKSKKALKINAKTGKVKVKKGTRKGTYKIKVTVTASGNSLYNAGSKTVNVSVKVK